jgi:cytoskeletal protein CcmA (bactofilin family)
MLNKKTEGDVVAFLGRGTEFSGKLILNGSIRIEGVFKGEIVGGGILTIGEGARIEAAITVGHIVIHGDVEGNLEAKERLEICSTGKVKGNIRTPILVIQEGALFIGDCQMGAAKAAESKEPQRK